MLLDGPPAIAMSPSELVAPPPFMLRAPEIVGFNTRIGIGDVALITPQTAVAPMFCVVVPRSIPAKKVGILSVNLTERNAFAATVVGGACTPGGALAETR